MSLVQRRALALAKEVQGLTLPERTDTIAAVLREVETEVLERVSRNAKFCMYPDGPCQAQTA